MLLSLHEIYTHPHAFAKSLPPIPEKPKPISKKIPQEKLNALAHLFTPRLSQDQNNNTNQTLPLTPPSPPPVNQKDNMDLYPPPPPSPPSNQNKRYESMGYVTATTTTTTL